MPKEKFNNANDIIKTMIDALIEKSVRVLLNSEGPITTKIISEQIGVSVSSIKHNMDYIKKVVATSGCEVVSMPGKGMWINGDDSQIEALKKIINENRDKSFYYEYRKRYILSILLQNKSNYTIQIFADDLNVSKNIIINDLSNIEKWLNSFDLKLSKKRNKGVNIEGDEFNIRQAIIMNNASKMEEVKVEPNKPEDIDYRICQNFYSYFTEVYPNHNLFSLQDYLRKAEDKLNVAYDDTSFSQLVEYIAVSKDRLESGNTITKANILNRCKVTPFQQEIAAELLRAALKNQVEISETEAKCLAAEFNVYNAYGINDNSMIKEAYFNEKAKIFVDTLTQIIDNKKLLVNEKLISDISNLFQKKKVTKTYKMSTFDYFITEFKSESASIYAAVFASIVIQEVSTRMLFTENDIAYIAMLIENAIDYHHQDLRILLYTSFDYNTGNYLENKIKRSVDGVYKVKAIREADLAKTNVNKYDLVITTSPCPIPNSKKITRNVNEADINYIQELVKKKLKDLHKQSDNEKLHFNEDLIFVNEEYHNKEEILDITYTTLKNNGYVNSSYAETVLRRINNGYITLGENAALSVTYGYEVEKDGIMVITLNKPINWNKDKVKIIINIVINGDDKENDFNCLRTLYNIFEDRVLYKKIENAKDKAEIIDINKVL